jgi:dolichol-phosphate mannosyltransferase
MQLEANLTEMERTREAYWSQYKRTASIKLRWRAITVRHCFHVLPGESILEIGAGTGLWTEHLSAVLSGENPIAAVIFNPDLAERARRKSIPNVTIVEVTDFVKDLAGQQFDYIVGTAILCHNQYAHHLSLLYRLLKPGGQILFFEANFWNPQVLLKSAIPPLGRWAGNASCQIGVRKYRLMKAASHQGFTNVEILPFDIIHPLTPRRLIRLIESMAFIIEHAPLMRELCGTLFIWAKKPGERTVSVPDGGLAMHLALFESTSVVVPCHNESMNIPALVERLLRLYGTYIHEIIIVNDNSTDSTADVTLQLAKKEPRIKLVDRKPPNGVGRALRDGYAAATGKYILTMDADFVHILPEFRDLFDVVAAGHDGAIGSRFSYDSVLINYPFLKILCNRAFHFLVKLVLLPNVRDVSNNLKLYRADILKNLDIEEPGFAANIETGLKPLLMGYDIKEVPISWINRTVGMGSSSFRIVRVAPDYFTALLSIVWRARRNQDRLQPTRSLRSRDKHNDTSVAHTPDDSKGTDKAAGSI